MDIIRAIEQQQIREDLPEFFVGSHVKVHYRIKEGNRERIQVFEGDVIRRHGASNRETFTVRKISFGIGVERVACLRYDLPDLRMLMTGDMRFLKQF